jgi:hypothetical protein
MAGFLAGGQGTEIEKRRGAHGRFVRDRFAKPKELTPGSTRVRIRVAGKKALGRVLYYEN